MPFAGEPVVAVEVALGVAEVAEVGGGAAVVVTGGLVEAGLDTGVVLTVEKDVGVVGTTGLEVGVVFVEETGLTGAAVFSKQVQPLDNLEAGTPARFFGTC